MKSIGIFGLKLRPPATTHFAGVCSGRDARVSVHSAGKLNIRALSRSAGAGAGGKVSEKPSICTADELHYVPVRDSNWRLALWRYRPSSPVGIKRNHPLLLLSGLGTNAIGYDLAPGSSFARFMSLQGFDTWILEVRGAGLSVNDGLAPSRLDSSIANQVRNWSKTLGNIFAELQRSVGLQQQQFSLRIGDVQKQLDVIVKYDWDFDHYLEEDVPAAIEYIRTHCKPKSGKLLAVGHSMGGILLYAMLSRNGYSGRESELASVVTLASSLDYSTSRSSLRTLLPLVDPAQALSVPGFPLGALMAAAYPLASRPPYFLSWLNPQVSALNMMQPEMLEKLVLKNFCTIPANLLRQLSTVFQEGGLRDRCKSFIYKDHLHKSKVPILALAGDEDRICPIEAVYETVKLIPRGLVNFKVFGEPSGPHYAHYDLVGGRLAPIQVYPCIIEFLQHHDLA